MTTRRNENEVMIPGPLLSYTRRQFVTATGTTLGELLEDLERQFPGIRFRIVDEQHRIRAHMRCFINGTATFELSHPITSSDRIAFVQALSGG